MSQSARTVVLLAVVVLALSLVASSAKITSLPSYNGPQLSMYSGYIQVEQKTNKNLFYWLIESENDPANDPIVLWLNGGPGCSSVSAIFTENGPLTLQSDGSISYNNLGWTKHANMLYLEMPVNVGFSYSNQNIYTTSDNETATDNYIFLQKFFQQYPQYQGRDFWIAGESYAGVYIPTLTEKILDDSSTQLFQQFKGFMAGNPVFNCKYTQSTSTAIQFNLLYWHGLVSYTQYHKFVSTGCTTQTSTSAICIAQLQAAKLAIGYIDQELQQYDTETPIQASLDPDDLYQDFCTGNGTLEFTVSDPTCKNTDSGSLNTVYLNRADVQAAIGARPTNWQVCAGPPKLVYFSSGEDMVVLYEKFFVQKPGFHILVYSGDIDIATVPFGLTQPCLFSMGRSQVSSWQPWTVNGWTAGYVEVFDTFTYATIKGAGHEAPTYQPLNALNMFSRFLNNQTLDDANEKEAVSRRLAWKNIQKSKSLRQGDVLRMHGIRP
eukprot:TRINITY_DN18_c0_g1_i1.p2 TRINITY_DN18_c0_g1~~TRINITY_DN18_c0_g1_i1.p2  ORF type:complete len:492 (+),score=224.66 TRINITY_DN18_c0_g1_i1:78-1553(+)